MPFDIGTGQITIGDLEEVFGSRKHAREVFDLVDTNGDGVISFLEFQAMMGDMNPDQDAASAHSRIKRHSIKRTNTPTNTPDLLYRGLRIPE